MLRRSNQKVGGRSERRTEREIEAKGERTTNLAKSAVVEDRSEGTNFPTILPPSIRLKSMLCRRRCPESAGSWGGDMEGEMSSQRINETDESRRVSKSEIEACLPPWIGFRSLEIR